MGVDSLHYHDHVVAAVSRYTGISSTEILGRRRHKNIANARHISAYILHRAGYSFEGISRVLGQSDHSSPINSTRKVEGLIQQNPALFEEISALEMQIDNAYWQGQEAHFKKHPRAKDLYIARLIAQGSKMTWGHGRYSGTIAQQRIVEDVVKRLYHQGFYIHDDIDTGL